MKFPTPAAAAVTGAAQAQIGTPAIRRGEATRIDLATLSRSRPLSAPLPAPWAVPRQRPGALQHGGWVR